MQQIHLSMADGIAEVRFERGKVNALDERLVDELSRRFDELAEHPEVRGIVLSGTGKFFSFGFDIPHFLSMSKDAFADYLGRFTALYRELFAHPKPVVAALNGHAVAGGCMLAAACDARIMVSGKAKIGLNEIGFGSSVFAGSVAMLEFWMGARRAQEMLFGGGLYSAEEAMGLGLVDSVVSDAELADAARALARRHATRDPAAFRSIKRLLRQPVVDAMLAREATSVVEFVDIWYSERTWKNLQEIKIHG
jgi:enoyl-CoA hydratase/carnithine racemase